MIVVDVETTGIDARKHSIVSIGAVEFEKSENQFYEECRIWEGAEIFEGGQGDGDRVYVGSLDINGFTKEQITDPNKKSLGQVIGEFLEWASKCKEKVLAGHNVWFDRDFLIQSAERSGIRWPLGRRIVDLHSLTYGHLASRGLKPPMQLDGRPNMISDFVFNYVGLPSEPKPHNALIGAKFEAEAFSRLMHEKNLFKEFQQYPIKN